jgi:error-prone DNA polymerase
MGFYQPAQIVIDARKHGVEVRPIDINYSEWDNKLEESRPGPDSYRDRQLSGGKCCALRLGFRQVKGLREEDMKLVIDGRKSGYTSIHQLREIGVTQAVLEKLADADAFRSIGDDRRKALWEVSAKDFQPQALFSAQSSVGAAEGKKELPEMTLSEHVVQDYAALSLSLKAHPVSFIREQFEQLHVRSIASLQMAEDKDLVKVAGLILVRQRPGTASGICFITIEDETGNTNLVVFKDLFDKYRKEIIQSRLLMVEGQLQREGEVIHVIVRRCFNISALLDRLVPVAKQDMTLLTLSRADEKNSNPDQRQKENEGFRKSVFHDGRNFK